MAAKFMGGSKDRWIARCGDRGKMGWLLIGHQYVLLSVFSAVLGIGLSGSLFSCPTRRNETPSGGLCVYRNILKMPDGNIFSDSVCPIEKSKKSD
jgi:hypothetical protein